MTIGGWIALGLAALIAVALVVFFILKGGIDSPEEAD